MKKSLFASALIAAVLPAHAATVVQWDFEGATTPADLSDSAASPAVAASLGSGTASGLHASAASDWTTPAGNGSANALSANTWGVGDYWQFSFSTLGYADLRVSFDQISSGTGPRDFKLAYSTNGTSFTDFASYSVRSNASPAWSSASPTGLDSFTHNLSAIAALDNQAVVTLRLIDTTTISAAGGTVATGGTDRIDNFSVMLTPVPEPTSWALMLAGLSAIGFIARRRG
ncbi:PEPxxWA-CTERM sorting domain-containing protein [Roseateles violae]|uniref:PEPxxWA-CTERM sorting domain-containing protein n=1 Tax=Roseateles violae TaxID=3058042 RepID=A0ABT8DV00_9BURK|nr:PEPxxWA-CTERM sorting domain-containing protein [Pelomonas sp. PFR6]MDN3920734.1 PEPxxWA-CTERM sorting domain-containing protein [Pelomonas sp. PFR6]